MRSAEPPVKVTARARDDDRRTAAGDVGVFPGCRGGHRHDHELPTDDVVKPLSTIEKCIGAQLAGEVLDSGRSHHKCGSTQGRRLTTEHSRSKSGQRVQSGTAQRRTRLPASPPGGHRSSNQQGEPNYRQLLRRLPLGVQTSNQPGSRPASRVRPLDSKYHPVARRSPWSRRLVSASSAPSLTLTTFTAL